MGLCGSCFYLSEAPPSPMTPYSPLPPTGPHTVYLLLIHTGKGGEGGELTREKARGAIVHKTDRKYQYD
jgi:hypothetical protein